ncbi:Thioredoxin-1 [Entamoeba marina]
MGVEHINSEQTFSRFIREHSVVIVDFFATWCGPCKMIAPYFEELASQHPTIKFVKVDVDQGQGIAQKYSVRSMPTFILFKNGNEVDRFSGANRQKLLSFCQQSGSTGGRTMSQPKGNLSAQWTIISFIAIFVGVFIMSKLFKN